MSTAPVRGNLPDGAALPPLLRGLARSIGNTPMLAIRCRFRGRERTVFAKAEHFNLTGSIKDRMALHILTTAYEEGTLHPGDTIAEATSGNTGIAFAALGRALGHPVTIFMPDWMSRERVDLIRSFGAEIVPVSKAEGGFVGSIARAREFAAGRRDVFLPEQFENAANVAAHERTTGPEILWQLEAVGLAPDAFVAGVGTGGTVMGVGRGLRRVRPQVRVHPLEPAESPTLSTGHKIGSHRIQGISDEFVPAVVKLAELDRVVAVSDHDAVLLAQALASKLGLGVGISSGANLAGALLVQDELGPQSVVVTVFPDDNKKYLSTALLGTEAPRPGALAPEIELLGFDTLRRSCQACLEQERCGPGEPFGAPRLC
jgi:cysteine synthase A